MHKPLFLVTAGSVAAAGGLIFASALPAAAATAGRAQDPPVTCTVPNGSTGACSPDDDTPVTFTITSTGTLNITAPSGTPTPINLGAEAAPGIVSTSIIGSPGDFGPVTVTDTRATDPSPWTATVSSTDFLNTSTGLGIDTIPAIDATYATGTLSRTPDYVVSGLPFDTALTATPTVGVDRLSAAHRDGNRLRR